MTAHSPLRYLLAAVCAVSIAACGGGRDVTEAAADGGISSSDSEDQDTDTDSGSDTGTDTQDEESDEGNPGGPGDDGADDGGGDGGDEGGGNPGGPGDVLVFEESNVKFGEFRDTGSGHQRCEVEGKCTLAEPDIIEGEEDPESGVDFCLISVFEYSSGVRPNPDPEEPRDVFTEGATVTAQLKCPEPVQEEESEESGSEESGSEESETGESGSEESESGEIPAEESSVDDSGDSSQG